MKMMKSELKNELKIKYFNFSQPDFLKDKRSGIDIEPIRLYSATNEDSKYALMIKFG
jgi:hypothetical protein